MFIIAAVASNGVIGAKNSLPWRQSADLKRFKQLTSGHTVLMGRKTYESIGRPLPQRQNIVLTRQNLDWPGVKVVHSLAEITPVQRGDLFVIGGADLYAQTINAASKLYITEIQANVPGDTYFPPIDPKIWRETEREAHKKDESNQYDYDFVVYERI